MYTSVKQKKTFVVLVQIKVFEAFASISVPNSAYWATKGKHTHTETKLKVRMVNFTNGFLLTTPLT